MITWSSAARQAKHLSAALSAAAVLGCSKGPSSSALQLPRGIEADAGTHDAGTSDAQTAVSRRICDGSSEVRFAFSFSVDSFLPEASVLYDLGSDYLYVDGTCRYWVDQPTLIVDEYKYWRPVREGVLTTEQEAALHAAVGYDDFSRAPPCPTLLGVADASTARMWNGERVYRCPGGPDAPPGWPMRAELYSAATPVRGPMRIKLSVVNVDDNDLKYPWPLETPPDNYLVDYNDNKSFRIDDGAAVEALMRLRERLIVDATQTPGYYGGHIGILPGDAVLGPGRGYALVVRDELAFTDEDGQWSPPQ